MEDVSAGQPNTEAIETPIPIFINVGAGAEAEQALAEIIEKLRERRIAAEVRRVTPTELEDSIHAAVAQGRSMIAACGGDGTMSTAAAALAGRATVLVPIPTGSLNHFARRYGIPSIDAAVASIAERRVIHVSVGDINGEVFINNASCGIYPAALRRREYLRRWIPKWPAHGIGWLEALIRLPKLTLDLEVNDQNVTRQTPFFWAGIGRGSFQFPEQQPASEEAQTLEVVIVKAQTRAALLALGLSLMVRLALRKRPRAGKGLEVYHVHDVVVGSRRKKIDVALDGEISRMHPPLTIQIRVGALRLAVPKQTAQPIA